MAIEQLRPKVARFRARWRAHQHRLDPKRRIFIDGEPANATGSREQANGIKTNMTRTCGWAARGQRLTAHVPHGHWKTLTFPAGPRHDRIVAPFVLDGPINGEMFTAWVSQCLAPTLAPGDAVIADNLGSHKGRPARQLIRAAGAHLLFLPPCSPDLNPIEMVFAKLKTLFRKADERTIEASWRRVGTLLDAFTPDECKTYLRHAGYASIQLRQALGSSLNQAHQMTIAAMATAEAKLMASLSYRVAMGLQSLRRQKARSIMLGLMYAVAS